MRTFRKGLSATLSLLFATMLCSTSAAAQTSKPAGAAKKEIHFEVLSIQPEKPGAPTGTGFTPNPTPDGYRSSLTLWMMLMVAYAPGNNDSWLSVPMEKAPPLLLDHNPTWYIFDARVASEDREAWSHQSNKHELLRIAMQAALKDRCKLILHERPTQLPDYKLVIAKKGLRFKPTPPGAVLPKVPYPLASGGVMIADKPHGVTRWSFSGATIEDLVDFLNLGAQTPPVHDATGLTGRYNFAIETIEHPYGHQDRDRTIYNWPVGPLGLQLKPGKYLSTTLVIDHMEKPTAN